jgi:hypothetical protein
VADECREALEELEEFEEFELLNGREEQILRRR